MNINTQNERKILSYKKARRNRYRTEAIVGASYVDDLMLLEDTLVQARSLLHSMEQAAKAIGF